MIAQAFEAKWGSISFLNPALVLGGHLQLYNMEGTVGEKLFAGLMGTVGTKSADEFYNEFTLTDTSYSEYHFKEMKEIFHLPGMDKWIMVDKMVNGTKEEGDSISSSPEKMQT